MESGNKKLAVNAALNTAKTVLGLLFPLITYPYVSRVLGVDNLGIYTFSVSIVSYFQLLAALGVTPYGIREGTQYRNDKEKIEEFVSEVFSINLISTAFSYLVLGLCLAVVPKLADYRTAILILSIEIIVTTAGVAWVCNIYEDFLFITVRTLAIQVVSLLFTFLFIRSEGDVLKYCAIMVLASSGANLLNFYYIRKKYCRFRFTLHIDWKRHLRPILVIFSTSVAITIYVSSDSTMLGFMTSDHEVGLYGTAVKIYTILKNLLAALLIVLIPRFSYMFSKGEEEESRKLFSKVFSILSILMLPMIVGLFMLSEDVILLISGEAYLGGAPALRILSLAVLFSLYAYLYTQCILIPVKREDVVFKATLLGAVSNVALNLVLIPVWGINAAAFTTIVAEAITFSFAYYQGRRFVRLENILGSLAASAAGCIGVVAVCLLAQRIEHLFLRLGTAVLGSAVLYFVILIALRNREAIDLIHLVLKKR